jgi:hypothetical protein
MGDPLMGLDVAEADFDRMCDAYGITRDLEVMEPDERLEFAELKKRFAREIQRGRVVLDAEGLASVHIAGREPIRFHRPTGAVLIAMGEKDDGGPARLNRALQAMTKSAPGTFTALLVRDFNLCAGLAGLFLSEG